MVDKWGWGMRKKVPWGKICIFPKERRRTELVYGNPVTTVKAFQSVYSQWRDTLNS